MSAKKTLQRSFVASAIVNVSLICLLGYFQSGERIIVAKANGSEKKAAPSPAPSALTIGIERITPAPASSPRMTATPRPTDKRATPRSVPSPASARIPPRARTGTAPSSPVPSVSPSTIGARTMPSPPAARVNPMPSPSAATRTQSESPANPLAASPGATPRNADAARSGANRKEGDLERRSDALPSASMGTPGSNSVGAASARRGDKPWQGQPATGTQAAAVRSRIASAGTGRAGDSAAKTGSGSSGAGNGVKAGTYRFVPPSTAATGSGNKNNVGKNGTAALGTGGRNGTPGAGGTTGANNRQATQQGVGGGAKNSGGNPSGPGAGKEANGNSGTLPGGVANIKSATQGGKGAGNAASSGAQAGGAQAGGNPAGGNPNGSTNTTAPNGSGDGQGGGQNNGGRSGVLSKNAPNGAGGGADDAGYRYNAPGLPAASRPGTNSRAGALILPRTRTTPTPRPTDSPAPTPTPPVAPSPRPTPRTTPTPDPTPTPTPAPSPTPKPRKLKAKPKPEEPVTKQIAGSYSKRGTVVVDAAKIVAPKPRSKKPAVKKPVRRRVSVAKLPKASPSPKQTPSPTPSPKPSVTPTPTPTPRPTPTPKPTPKPTATPPPDLQGDGTGLKADYFLGANFEKFLFSRAEPKIEFEWQRGGPDARIPAKNAWSVRWTGRVRPVYSEEYTFFTAADDGTRLWVNGQQLIDDWTIHGVSEVSGKIRLEGGRLYDIRVEFFEKNGDSNYSCKVYWESPRQKREFIPQTAFYFPQ